MVAVTLVAQFWDIVRHVGIDGAIVDATDLYEKAKAAERAGLLVEDKERVCRFYPTRTGRIMLEGVEADVAGQFKQPDPELAPWVDKSVKNNDPRKPLVHQERQPMIENLRGEIRWTVTCEQCGGVIRQRRDVYPPDRMHELATRANELRVSHERSESPIKTNGPDVCASCRLASAFERNARSEEQ